ncbi:MAG: DNA alkylation repair protein [Tenericutes bacterium]|nr:DNA alkylation repair protein [Mycoplasmatota bacterium]
MFEELNELHRHKKPMESSRYHKQYIEGEADYYVGITVPELRKYSKQNFKKISLKDLDKLMHAKIHEYRLLALIILGDKIKKTDENQEKAIINYYLKNLKFVNYWDLVDASAYQLLGMHLFKIKDYSLLFEFSKSNDLWIKRISIVATNYMIRNREFNLTLAIVDNLLEDEHDLIHKANGWMLRNVGDKNKDLLTKYIKKNYNIMPRTTLRYAIEHYPEIERKKILKGEFI